MRDGMQAVCCLILLTGAYPLWQAWQANRRTTLLQATTWALFAWAAWVGTLASAAAWPGSRVAALGYLALSLTGCAGIAVLGARRPVVYAWNFVVLSLLAVLLLPLAESLLGDLRFSEPRLLFLAAVVAVGVLNYLPTRLGLVAVGLGVACGTEISRLALPDGGSAPPAAKPVGPWLLAVLPWVGYGLLRTRRPAPSEFDALWLAFRDRFGLVWGQQTREPFNRAAANAGWPVFLYWRGLRVHSGSALPDAATQAAIVTTLRALLKRFGPEEC